MVLYSTSLCVSYVNVNAKQGFQKINKSILRMLHGENRAVTFNLAVEVIGGVFSLAVEVINEILTPELSSHSMRNARNAVPIA